MLRKHHFNNTGFSLFVLIVSVIYLLSATTLGPPVVNARLSASFFPLILGGLSIVLSAALVIRTIHENHKAGSENDSAADVTAAGGHYRALLAMAATGVFIAVFQWLGFFVATIPYVLSIILIFSNREKVVQKLIYSVLIATAGYVIFNSIFKVRLPVFWG